MKEADFQKWIVDVALRFGWHCWHVPSPMRNIGGGKWIGAREGAGLPDLILIHDDPPRLLFLEVKVETGRLSPAQQHFLQMAKAVADISWTYDGDTKHVVGVHVVWPGQEPVIEQILRSKVVM
jgi:hypothetical protein